MSFCGKCGASIPDGSKFCPKCGNPMVSQVNSPEPGVPNPGVTGEFPPVDPAPQPEPAPFNYNQYGSSGGSDYSGPSYEPGKKGSGKLVLILVIAIVAIVAVILILLFTTGIDVYKRQVTARTPLIEYTHIPEWLSSFPFLPLWQSVRYSNGRPGSVHLSGFPWALPEPRP